MIRRDAGTQHEFDDERYASEVNIPPGQDVSEMQEWEDKLFAEFIATPGEGKDWRECVVDWDKFTRLTGIEK